MQRNITYDQINVSNNEKSPVIDGYCYIENKLFYSVCKPEFYDELSNQYDTSPLNTNWKAHLSCSQNALPQLWNIVVPILQQNDCPAFKCIKLCNVSDAQKNLLFGQRCVDAMQFSIYIAPSDEKKYIDILNQIETLLIQNNIAKTDQSHIALFKSDKRIGVYTSVRHSKGLDGKYLSVDAAQKLCSSNHNIVEYNCAGAEDPFKEMASLINMRSAESQTPKLGMAKTSMWQLAQQVIMKEKENNLRQGQGNTPK